jgi:ATP-dependent DNA helicase RecQ
LRERPRDQAALIKTLCTRVLQREAREIERLRQIARWVEQDECQVAALGKHFGDPLDKPCGHCSWCQRGGKQVHLPAIKKREIDPASWSQAAELRKRQPKELGPPRAFARFLCGVSSPWLVKAKLQQHQLFGMLADVPFDDVLRKAGL